MNVRVLLCLAVLFPATVLTLRAASGPASLRTTPSAGIRIPERDRVKLEQGAAALAGDIAVLRAAARTNERVARLLPDVEIFHKAVDWALRYDEFFRSNEVGLAHTLLDHGMKRAQRLAQGDPFWLTSTGLVVRGFRSKIDDSVQPYGLVVPATFAQSTNRPRRLDVWLHGRDDHLTELKFLSDRLRSYGEFTPPDTFVLHPYGRFCNAFKFAGETDVFEALEHAKKSYPVDDLRLGLRGFSMGGAGVWHLAAHHPSVWAAAAPGAGFAETAEYTGALKKEPKPTWWEQKLWKLYDATEYAANFHNLPVIAYSGELDKQKQAADVMARAMKAEGLELQHIIGPGVGHKYEPGAKKELARRFDELMAKGRDPWPRKVVFATATLKYNQSHWMTVERMEKPWETTRVEAEFTDEHTLRIATTNVSELTLDLTNGPFLREGEARLIIDGQSFNVRDSLAMRNWKLKPRKFLGKWAVEISGGGPQLKRREMQGPLDDAFTGRFLVVPPLGKSRNEPLNAWVGEELARFTNEWRAQFRGDVRMVDSANLLEMTKVTSGAKRANLVLWGDPTSNPAISEFLLFGTATQGTAQWTGSSVRFGTNKFDAAKHLPILIFPHPRDPSHYVVINSGPTFLEFGAGSNAQQTPKLPDFAIIDITVPRAERLTKGVKLAGFFDEQWRLPEGPQP